MPEALRGAAAGVVAGACGIGGGAVSGMAAVIGARVGIPALLSGRCCSCGRRRRGQGAGGQTRAQRRPTAATTTPNRPAAHTQR